VNKDEPFLFRTFRFALLSILECTCPRDAQRAGDPAEAASQARSMLSLFLAMVQN